jgi:hypothetical protein
MKLFGTVKKQATAFILVFILICLPGCEKKASGSGTPKNDDLIIRQDEEGLVEVRIKNGEATVSFDLDKWERLYNLSLYIEEYVYTPYGTIPKKGPFQISGLSGKVLDACVGKVPELDYYYFPYEHFEDFFLPSIMLLTEDGTVSWLLATPIPLEQLYDKMLIDGSFYIDGKLPLLNNIVSLSYENDSEGFGKKTFFANTLDGSRYNLLLFCRLLTLCDVDWYCLPVREVPDFSLSLLSFDESGGVTFRRRNENGFIVRHEGTYEISLNKDNERFPAAVSLDLSLGWWDTFEVDGNAKNPPQKISGKYSMETDGELWVLWQADGDPLFIGDSVTPEGYTLARFSQPDEYMDMSGESLWFFQNEILYVLENLCEETINNIAKGMVVVNGEEKTVINGDYCHIVHLGNYVNDKHFETKAIYAVNDRYEVYRYDAKTKKWISLVMG